MIREQRETQPRSVSQTIIIMCTGLTLRMAASSSVKVCVMSECGLSLRSRHPHIRSRRRRLMKLERPLAAGSLLRRKMETTQQEEVFTTGRLISIALIKGQVVWSPPGLPSTPCLSSKALVCQLQMKKICLHSRGSISWMSRPRTAMVMAMCSFTQACLMELPRFFVARSGRLRLRRMPYLLQSLALYWMAGIAHRARKIRAVLSSARSVRRLRATGWVVTADRKEAVSFILRMWVVSY